MSHISGNVYIDKRSNHPPSITKHLPASINRRISSLSSSELAFDSVANVYEVALHKSNYNGKLEYSPDNPRSTTTQKRKRQRNIIWFNPPFSKNVRSNIARDFLRLLDKHFPKANSLHKIFNRNSPSKSGTAAWKMLKVLFPDTTSASWRKPSQSKAQANCVIAESLVNAHSRKSV